MQRNEDWQEKHGQRFDNLSCKNFGLHIPPAKRYCNSRTQYFAYVGYQIPTSPRPRLWRLAGSKNEDSGMKMWGNLVTEWPCGHHEPCEEIFFRESARLLTASGHGADAHAQRLQPDESASIGLFVHLLF